MKNTIHYTRAYLQWFDTLRDRHVQERIALRIDRARRGNFGDHHSLGGGVSEMRIDYGSGYRIYYAQKGNTIYLLLLGGDKQSQAADIKKAKKAWLDIGGKHHGKER